MGIAEALQPKKHMVQQATGESIEDLGWAGQSSAKKGKSQQSPSTGLVSLEMGEILGRY